LQDDDPEVLEDAIRFMYTEDFKLLEIPSGSEEEKSAVARRLIQLYVLGDKYSIRGLCDVSCAKLNLILQEDTWSMEEMLQVVEYCCLRTQDQARLRTVVKQQLLRLDFGALIKNDDAKDTLLENPEFMYDILQTLAEEMSVPSKLRHEDEAKVVLAITGCEKFRRNEHCYHCLQVKDLEAVRAIKVVRTFKG